MAKKKNQEKTTYKVTYVETGALFGDKKLERNFTTHSDSEAFVKFLEIEQSMSYNKRLKNFKLWKDVTNTI